MQHAALVPVRIHHAFGVAAERVFDAWLNPATARRFLFATPGGTMVRTEMDARPGGSFLVVERRGEVDVEHMGVYLEIDRPRHLSFVFRVPLYWTESSCVRLGLIPREGGCELSLTHEGVLPELSERVREGWQNILTALEAALTESAP